MMNACSGGINTGTPMRKQKITPSLKGLDFASASARIKKNIPLLLKIWAERVRIEIPVAARQSDENLFNSLEGFLEKLFESISSQSSESREQQPSANIDLCQKHAEQRAKIPGYSLHNVIQEYRILRQTLISILEQE